VKIFKLIIKNVGRHKLRTSLTVVGIFIAVLAFGIMRTVVTAWYAGVNSASTTRLVTVQKVSFIYDLPMSYRDQILHVPGVKEVSWANWFGGVYIDKNQFFARMAVDPETFFDLYPEFRVTKEEVAKFQQQQNACIIGAKTAKLYNLKPGDLMNMDGDIYPGKWQFQVVGIYHGQDEATDETQMFFNWHYLDEQVKINEPGRQGRAGWYIIAINDVEKRAAISQSIDDLFANSSAETKTQTEKEFNQGFISMSGAILSAINVISIVIIGIILLILANTMIMTARERIREYAVLKTLGFSAKHLFWLIAGESMAISMLGGLLGLILLIPAANAVHAGLPVLWFPVFQVDPWTLVFALCAALGSGVLSAIFPIRSALKMRIVDGLRQIG
jgi:putative ABC transport system permease protein